MKDINFFSKIYIAVDPVDFRKQANGLALLVKHTLDENPLETRAIFVFTNKRKTSVKAIYWDETGFAMWVKVLEKDKFKWPKVVGGSKIAMNAKEIKWLLQGVDLSKIKTHRPVTFPEIS